MELSFTEPYCFGSIDSDTSSVTQLHMNDSIILAKVGVREIVRMYFSRMEGGFTLASGKMLADFHIGGRYPSRILLLNKAHTGPARLHAPSRNIQLGMLSEPMAFLMLILLSLV